MTKICSLEINRAIEAIQHTDTVMYKRGSTGDYSLANTSEVISGIRSSGYGANVYRNEIDKVMYVSIPYVDGRW